MSIPFPPGYPFLCDRFSDLFTFSLVLTGSSFSSKNGFDVIFHGNLRFFCGINGTGKPALGFGEEQGVAHGVMKTGAFVESVQTQVSDKAYTVYLQLVEPGHELDLRDFLSQDIGTYIAFRKPHYTVFDFSPVPESCCWSNSTRNMDFRFVMSI
ncbi:hypothetical protein [Saccharicrinis sp. GN24d3]|uniref:hypothetical protein n=1 Tax=Saccharicrinis sp. GN24d3 TaxID=3458416 RepID=UPI0040374104